MARAYRISLRLAPDDVVGRIRTATVQGDYDWRNLIPRSFQRAAFHASIDGREFTIRRLSTFGLLWNDATDAKLHGRVVESGSGSKIEFTVGVGAIKKVFTVTGLMIAIFLDILILLGRIQNPFDDWGILRPISLFILVAGLVFAGLALYESFSASARLRRFIDELFPERIVDWSDIKQI